MEPLQDERILSDAKILSEYLHTNFSMASVIQGVVNRILCHKAFPDYAAKEEKVRTAYIEGRIDLPTAQHKLARKLTSLSLL